VCKGSGRSWGGVLLGDVLTRLAELRVGSVSCVVTSPPYWSLRKYDAPDVVWGGDAACDHGELRGLHTGIPGGASAPGGYADARRWQSKGVSRQETPDAWVAEPGDSRGGSGPGAKEEGNQYARAEPKGTTCSRCGAWRGQFGLEPNPELYVEHTIQVLRAIRRVLRDDGVVWWNIGDGYASRLEGAQTNLRWQHAEGDWAHHETTHDKSLRFDAGAIRASGLKPKDLVLMPFRIALAAQADGWWVRSVVIWSKPNAMPESAGDRPTSSHEYILMLTKNGAKPLYWYLSTTGEMTKKHPSARTRNRWKEGVDWEYSDPDEGRRRRITRWVGVPYWWDQEAVREAQINPDSARARPVNATPAPDGLENKRTGFEDYRSYSIVPGGRNVRSVWTFPTAQTPEAHFATFPPELPRRCISAACPREVCTKCGRARVRLVESSVATVRSDSETLYPEGSTGNRISTYRQGNRATYGQDTRPTPTTTGWSDCPCEAPDYQPGIVLDPFAGTGTSLWVARQLGRRFIGIELSETYAEMARQKLGKWWDPPNLAPRPAQAGQAEMWEGTP
jgi:DNA modification methylase